MNRPGLLPLPVFAVPLTGFARSGRGPLRPPLSRPPLSRSGLYWLLLAAGVICFCVDTAFLAHATSPLCALIALIGSGTCGLSWLMTRALFPDPAPEPAWPVGLVAAMFGLAVLDMVARPLIGPQIGPLIGSLIGIADGARGLISSAALVLTALEPLKGLRAADTGERRFRLSYVAGYAGLLLVAVLIDPQSLRAAGLGVTGDGLKITCALLALIGASVALWRRGLSKPETSDPLPSKRESDLDPHLDYVRERIRQQMRLHELYLRPDLKVRDLARRIGEPEYRVSQAIAGMGVSNFNRLINAHRLERARQMLRDPAQAHGSILSIALDCGFGSIGPFNRAFREAEGLTPQQYRRATLKNASLMNEN